MSFKRLYRLLSEILLLKRNIFEDISYFLQGLGKKRIACPYCKTKDYIIYDKKYLVIDICKCKQCGLFFVNPIYAAKKVEEFYDNCYSSGATFIPEKQSLESMIRTGDFSSIGKDFRDRLSIIKQLSNGNRLLEFGSSWGYFLYQAKQYGFICKGVEISKKRSYFGQKYLGVDIINNLAAINEKFDIIYTSHTLEHLVDLQGIFDEFYKMLVPGGKLIIEVPNFDPEVKGKSVYSIIGKVHPLGFNKDFFEKNLQKHGFLDISIAGNYQDLLKEPSQRLPLKDVIIVQAKKRRN
ncbi:MAG: hypothetical protein DRP84_08260 [Spirochaetes bacterium]|nr:MAG: hypothetical protein DRP84_08260 [Spirochaetota bacterium]